MAKRIKLVLKGYEPISGDKARRFRNIKTGETISRRQFATRAERVEYTTTPKVKKTAKQHRAELFANWVNRDIYLTGGHPSEYLSFKEVEENLEFQIYEGFVHSRVESDRDYAREFYDELEEIYAAQDWGETP